ncbi:DsrE family protein [Jannaschia sp. R86511]|uniref:DsrE family protein n=1 Tax=Jannaschia sp. R86511 TaxID=3093853 RepID=UPI0036D417CF
MTTTAAGPASARLVVKVTCGAEAPERCNQALTVAATALAAGAQVSLWLTGGAVDLARTGAAGFTLEHAADPLELLAAVLADGQVTVCTQCAARRGLTATDLPDGVRIAGAAVFVAEALDPTTTALVY